MAGDGAQAPGMSRQGLGEGDGEEGVRVRREAKAERGVYGGSEEEQGIPVQVGHRPTLPPSEQRNPVRRIIKRSNKLVQALSVPRMTLYNVRSAWAKWDNIAEDIDMRNTDIMFLTEVWEKSENKGHQKSIEAALELKGLKYVSTPRPGARRGGGTALLSAEKNFHLTKLNINIPKPLEACFALLKPTNPTGKLTKFICISFYSPPRCKSNKKLIEFLTSTVAKLRTEHLRSGVIMAADINDLKLPVLLSYDPTMKQIVRGFTNKKQDKILDCFITDLHGLLQEPTILPPMQVDPGKKGKDGDHMGVECVPRNTLMTQGSQMRERVTVQPFPESGLVQIGFTLLEESWEGMEEENMSSSGMVAAFEERAKNIVDQQFPMKVVSVGEADLPYFTEELRKIKRQRQRAYTDHGRRSLQYINLKTKFELKKKRAATNYVARIEKEVTEGARGSGYSAIRKLGDRPAGVGRRKEVVVPSYIDQQLSPEQAANRLAVYFSAVSQTVEPLDETKFHPALRLYLEEGRRSKQKPIITQHAMYCCRQRSHILQF